MKLNLLDNRITLGCVVNHTYENSDDATGAVAEKYLPAEQVIAKVRAVDAALGRECAFAEMYNEAGGGLTFPALAKDIPAAGKVPWLNLCPDTLPDWQTPVPEHSLGALASGASDYLIRRLAEHVGEFATPVIVCADEASGSPWANQGTPAERGDLFVEFWKRLHAFAKLYAPNATLALRYAPGWDDANDWRRSRHWWPGPEYVDQVWVNAPAYTVQTNGTELWPLETSPGDPWTPARAYQMVLDEFATLPGAESLPWGVGCVGSEHPGDPAGKGLWFNGLLGKLAANQRISSFSLFADDSYARNADVSMFPRTANNIRSQYRKARFTSQIGVA